MSLTGTVTGSTRFELIEAAGKEARAYYGGECVVVTLKNEVARELDHLIDGTIIVNYEATYTADPGHFSTWPLKTTCTRCGAEVGLK